MVERCSYAPDLGQIESRWRQECWALDLRSQTYRRSTGRSQVEKRAWLASLNNSCIFQWTGSVGEMGSTGYLSEMSRICVPDPCAEFCPNQPGEIQSFGLSTAAALQ
jgi:hypothetical protein